MDKVTASYQQDLQETAALRMENNEHKLAIQAAADLLDMREAENRKLREQLQTSKTTIRLLVSFNVMMLTLAVIVVIGWIKY